MNLLNQLTKEHWNKDRNRIDWKTIYETFSYRNPNDIKIKYNVMKAAQTKHNKNEINNDEVLDSEKIDEYI